MRHAFWVMTFCLIAWVTALGQRQSCTLEVAVGLIDKNGSLLNDMTPQDVSVSINDHPVTIESLSYDTGPRRILFLVDTNRKLSAEKRGEQWRIMERILSGARKGDEFALMTTGELKLEMRFSADVGPLLDAAKQLTSPPEKPAHRRSLLDSLTESIEWFGPSQPGDAIFVIAGSTDNRKAHYDAVEKALQQRHIRVFGFAFGPSQMMVREQLVDPGTPGIPARDPSVTGMSNLPRSFGAPGSPGVRGTQPSFGNLTLIPEDIPQLAWSSGGYTEPDMTLGEKPAADESQPSPEKLAWQMYGAIAQFYVLRVKVDHAIRNGNIRLHLSPELRRQRAHLGPRLLYSRGQESCSLAAAIK